MRPVRILAGGSGAEAGHVIAHDRVAGAPDHPDRAALPPIDALAQGELVRRQVREIAEEDRAREQGRAQHQVKIVERADRPGPGVVHRDGKDQGQRVQSFRKMTSAIIAMTTSAT